VKLLSLDVETSGNQPGYGLQPCRALTGDAWLTSIAFASRGGVSATLDPSVEMIRRVLVDCARRKITIVGWNTPFDMAWLIAIGLRDEVFACDWLDGMLIWRHLTCSPDWTGLAPKSYGLKAAVAEHRPEFAGYDEDIDFDDESPEAREKLRVYNGADADHTLWLVEKFWADLSPKQRRVALLEARCLPLVAEAHVLGIHGNTDAAVALAEKLEADADAAYQALTADGEAIDPAVLASPTKLRKLLFEDWGLPVVKLTDKGAESTDKDALSQLAPLDPRAGMLHDYREARNNRTKFAVGMARSLAYNGAGVTRPVARVFGTYTSRMTYSSAIGKGKNQLFTGVALHQWKRDQLFRSLIEAPAGYTLIEWDFAGQEFRWMAVLSGDATMLKMCAPGEDAHAYMGGQVSGRTYADMQAGLELGDTGVKGARQLGKVANLSCQYRTSARTLRTVARTQHRLTLNEHEAQSIWTAYRRTYPGVKRYWQDQCDKARHTGIVETIAGRRVHLGKGPWPREQSWGRESAAINYPVQGSGADQKYLALAALRTLLPRYGGRFYFELHDGLFAIVPDEHAVQACREIKHALSNLPYEKAWGVQLPTQFPVAAKLGKSRGSLKAYKE